MADLRTFRSAGGRSAVLFIHGFAGSPSGTWADFPVFLSENPALVGWDIFSFGYPSSLLPGTRGAWSSDPDLPKLSLSLTSELEMQPLSKYSKLAIIAHSMGGLIAQRFVLDSPALVPRISHLLLFGTPSAGIDKANFVTGLVGRLFTSDAVRNMASNSEFIRLLRSDWDRAVDGQPAFQFLAVAGDRDNFVRAKSSLAPFPARFQRIVSGDHLSMVKPPDAERDVVRLVVSALAPAAAAPAETSSPLRLAAELGQAAPEGVNIARQFAANAQTPLTEAQIVEAALALDRIGEREQAVAFLAARKDVGTDVQGTLAGRLKRRWIQEGVHADAQFARELYRKALVASLQANDIGQIFYHAINGAFLSLLAFNDAGESRKMAELALEYARKRTPADVWSAATEAEALLYLGEDEKALEQYRKVLAFSPEKWKLLSTGQQAQQIAAKLGKPELAVQLENIFDPPSAARPAAAS